MNKEVQARLDLVQHLSKETRMLLDGLDIMKFLIAQNAPDDQALFVRFHEAMVEIASAFYMNLSEMAFDTSAPDVMEMIQSAQPTIDKAAQTIKKIDAELQQNRKAMRMLAGME